jgi:carbon storage regulator CsrA
VAAVRLASNTAAYRKGFSMLVLSCKLGERIVLPGIGTTVSVVAIKGKVARLGISAPIEVTVHRAEFEKHISHRIRAAGGQKEFRRHE